MHRNQVTHVDGRLGGVVSRRTGGLRRRAAAECSCTRSPWRAARMSGSRSPATGDRLRWSSAGTPPIRCVSDGQVISGTPPPGPAWRARVRGAAAQEKRDRVQPLNDSFAETGRAAAPRSIEHRPRTGGRRARRRLVELRVGQRLGVRHGEPYDASDAGGTACHGGRSSPATGGPGVYLSPPTRHVRARNAIDSRLRILVPLAAGLPAGALCAVFAAGKHLAGTDRARGRARACAGGRPETGDELSQLGATIDEISERAHDPHGRARGRARPLQGDAAALRRDAGRDPRPERAGRVRCSTPRCRPPAPAAAGCSCTTPSGARPSSTLASARRWDRAPTCRSSVAPGRASRAWRWPRWRPDG